MGALAGCSSGSDVLTNEAAAMIGGLSTEVNADNKDEYDYSARAMEYLEYIGQNLANRNVDGSGDDNRHDEATEWIVSELRKAGYSDSQADGGWYELEEFGIDLGKHTGNNIILTIPGEDTAHQIIVGAHYDGDGVGDNGSGTALLLATAAGLHGVTPHYTLKLIFFDGEEEGMLGSEYNASHMSDDDIDSTIYMINMDSLAFGDYCNIYGGSYGDGGIEINESQLESPQATEAYDFAVSAAEAMGIKTWKTSDLDGYYASNGTGPAIEENSIYTNPWTPENPAPANNLAMSPATLPASDHVGYMDRGIEYIYFEATNWYAESGNDEVEGTSYTGYIETFDYDKGEHGMFMNTEYDTWENLNTFYPGRAAQHFAIYSPLLTALLLVQ